MILMSVRFICDDNMTTYLPTLMSTCYHLKKKSPHKRNKERSDLYEYKWGVTWFLLNGFNK